jgi:hypothetical protein
VKLPEVSFARRGGTLFGGGTYFRTRVEDSGSFMRGSRWERWTRWNVAAFFLSMNFRGMLVTNFDVQPQSDVPKFCTFWVSLNARRN